MSIQEIKKKTHLLLIEEVEKLVDNEIVQNPQMIDQIVTNRLNEAKDACTKKIYTKCYFNIISRHFDSLHNETKMYMFQNIHCYMVDPVECSDSFAEWIIQHLVNDNRCCNTCQFWALCMFGTENATRFPTAKYTMSRKLIKNGFNVEVVARTLLAIGDTKSDIPHAALVELAEKPQRDAAMGFVDALRGFENLGNLPLEDTPKVMEKIKKTIDEIDEIASQKRTMRDILTKKARVEQ